MPCIAITSGLSVFSGWLLFSGLSVFSGLLLVFGLVVIVLFSGVFCVGFDGVSVGLFPDPAGFDVEGCDVGGVDGSAGFDGSGASVSGVLGFGSSVSDEAGSELVSDGKSSSGGVMSVEGALSGWELFSEAVTQAEESIKDNARDRHSIVVTFFFIYGCSSMYLIYVLERFRNKSSHTFTKCFDIRHSGNVNI